MIAKCGGVARLLAGLLCAVLLGDGYACNLSDLTLNSIVDRGGSYDISVTLCIGAGVTGAVRGADGDTRDIAFGFRREGLTLNSFAPAAITGQATGTVYRGFDGGPQPFLTGAHATVYYIDELLLPDAPPLACIYSTSVCGEAHQECTTYTFNVSDIPDSLNVFGVEGAGNAFAGCYPNPDMWIYPAMVGIRMTRVDTAANRVTIRNYATYGANVGAAKLAVSDSIQRQLSSLAPVGGGDLDLGPGEEVTVAFPELANANGVALLTPAIEDDSLRDYVQWGGSPGAFQGPAAMAGIWTFGTYASGPGPAFQYTGDGSQRGAAFWITASEQVVPTLGLPAALLLALLLAFIALAGLRRVPGRAGRS